MKTEYTFKEIQRLKQELQNLITQLEMQNLITGNLNHINQDIKGLKVEVKRYDAVLNQIGINGMVNDRDMVQSMIETSQLIKNIKLALK